jgi:hypothetical protein
MRSEYNLPATPSSGNDTNTFTKCGDTNQFVLGTGECIDYTPSTTYYPSTVDESGSGSITDSNIELIKYYDDLNMVFVEGNGANPLSADINFLGVTSFSQLALREYYLGSSSHVIKIQLWDYGNSSWEDYFEFVGQSGYTIIAVPVFDSTAHINGGLVQLRMLHVQNGISNHELYLDYAWLINGQNIGSSTNLIGFAKYNFGLNNFDGNGNFWTSGNVTATNLIGNGSGITGIPTQTSIDTNLLSYITIAQADTNYQVKELRSETVADQNTASLTAVNISGLSLSLQANSKYDFEAVISHASSTSAGLKFDLNFTTDEATVESHIIGTLAAGTVRAARIYAFNTLTAAFNTAGADGGATIKGTIITGANAGDLIVRHAKVTSGTSKIYKYSSITAKKVG